MFIKVCGGRLARGYRLFIILKTKLFLGHQTKKEEVQKGSYNKSKGLIGHFDTIGKAVFVPKDSKKGVNILMHSVKQRK